MPGVYATAGRYEIPFFVNTKRTARRLQAKGFDVATDYLYAGHDWRMWQIMFARHLPSVFNPPSISK